MNNMVKANLAMAERNDIIAEWYQAQDDDTREAIDDIGEQLERGIKDRRPGYKSSFGAKSKIELCWALARLFND